MTHSLTQFILRRLREITVTQAHLGKVTRAEQAEISHRRMSQLRQVLGMIGKENAFITQTTRNAYHEAASPD